MKIAIVTISLKNGGAERSTANLSKMLFKHGIDVHIICINPNVDYDYLGKIFIVKNKENESPVAYTKCFIKLKQYIKRNNFDTIIDSRTRNNKIKELIYLYWLYRDIKPIYMVSSSKIDNYLSNSALIAKIILNRCKNIVAVSIGVNNLIRTKFNTTKSICIENCVFPPKIFGRESANDYILYLGRIDNKVKNISLLLDSYKLSGIADSTKLYIIGSGPDTELIANKIENLNIKKSTIQLPYTKHVGDYIYNAKYLVLTSRYEGFGNVLTEALSIGTPVISVNCNYGPSEIIFHETNGLLVENHNKEALALAMRRMTYDTRLYEKCKKNAKASVTRFSFNNISQKWLKLLNHKT